MFSHDLHKTGIIETLSNQMKKSIENKSTQDINKLIKLHRNSLDYEYELLRIIADIFREIDQLLFIPKFIDDFPLDYSFISEGNYIYYHYTNHFVKLSTIVEQFSYLINCFYRLNLDKKDCKVEKIIQKTNLTCRSLKILKDFNSKINDKKRMRNEIVHRGIVDDNELNNLVGFSYWESYLIDKNSLFKEFFEDALIDKLKAKKQLIEQTLKEDNKLVCNYSKNILKELDKDLKKQYN